MDLLCRLLLTAILLGYFPARAQELSADTGIVCDTAKKVEQYVAEFTTVEDTLRLVNAEKPNVCGVLTVVFIRGATLSRVQTSRGEMYDVVEILVVGVLTPAGWMRVPPLTQYTLFVVKGRDT